MSRDNDWFFDTFREGGKPRTETEAKIIMTVLWLFIIAGVFSSIALAFNLRGVL